MCARREIAGNVDPEELANAGLRRNRLFECQFLVGSVGVEPSDAKCSGAEPAVCLAFAYEHVEALSAEPLSPPMGPSSQTLECRSITVIIPAFSRQLRRHSPRADGRVGSTSPIFVRKILLEGICRGST
jgi:hypothetical protein